MFVDDAKSLLGIETHVFVGIDLGPELGVAPNSKQEPRKAIFRGGR